MCLAIPSRIVSIDENLQGVVDVMGVTRTAAFDLTPQAKVGDYVLIHAGFAIEIVDEEFARETIELVQEMNDIVGAELAEASLPAMGADPLAFGAAPKDGE